MEEEVGGEVVVVGGGGGGGVEVESRNREKKANSRCDVNKEKTTPKTNKEKRTPGGFFFLLSGSGSGRAFVRFVWSSRGFFFFVRLTALRWGSFSRRGT